MSDRTSFAHDPPAHGLYFWSATALGPALWSLNSVSTAARPDPTGEGVLSINRSHALIVKHEPTVRTDQFIDPSVSMTLITIADQGLTLLHTQVNSVVGRGGDGQTRVNPPQEWTNFPRDAHATFREPGSVLVAETGSRTCITRSPLALAPSGPHHLRTLSVMLHVRPDNEVTWRPPFLGLGRQSESSRLFLSYFSFSFLTYSLPTNSHEPRPRLEKLDQDESHRTVGAHYPRSVRVVSSSRWF